MKNNNFLPFLVIGISLIICSIIFVTAWKSNYSSNQTITVTGSAKKDIISDFGILRGLISVEAPTAEIAYQELKRQKPILISYLSSNGFPEKEVELFTMNSYPIYEVSSAGYQTNKVRAYNYSQRIEIKSTDVNKIKNISLEIPSLIEKGVSFSVEQPEYHYTKIADVKIEIQAEAAKDAMNRASRIALSTGRELGPMRSARMGVIQITPRLSNQISDYGVNDLSSIEKEITAVVTASFEIE
ncbi:MAG: SIMPL domain-containing protein [Ignavibacteriaceae bacterium]|nr:SIMPL domain-containing protein [Ignavibacteriaceae bacterium]